jgi:hypothetical protein
MSCLKWTRILSREVATPLSCMARIARVVRVAADASVLTTMMMKKTKKTRMIWTMITK